MNCKISINQLADFSTASEKRKMQLVQQQKEPDMFRLPWYRTSKSTIIKSLTNHGDLDVVHSTISKLRSVKPSSTFQEHNQRGSIQALERFLAIKIPQLLTGLDVEVIKSSSKHLNLSGVEVIIAPELIIKAKVDGKTVIGAVKIHASKNNVFDLKQSRLVSSVMYKYLESKVAGQDEYVLPKLCLCLDVFSGRFVRTPEDVELRYNHAVQLCHEIQKIWNSA